MEKIPRFNIRRAFNKAVGPGKKNPKLINIGPMFMPYYRVFLFFLIVAKFYNFRQIQGIMRVH